MEAHTVIVPTQMAYMHIPTNELRNFADGMFPNLAHSSVADVAKGYGHRYVAGHDLLLDVPRTMSEKGVGTGLHQAGHILLTDFVTKAGIPIPGFSQSGLGHLLEQAGIHRGWLQVNLCDTGLGIIAISEGSSDLIQAFNGALLMSGSTFFDTFVEGGIEIGMAIVTQNPIMLAGGVENIAAGLVSVWHTVSTYVDPLVFFGSAGTSALIGFALSYGLAGQSLSKAAKDSIRSGTIGALFAVSPAFGFGALAGFVSYGMGSKLASLHNSESQALLKVDNNSYRLLLEELCAGNTDLTEFLNCSEPYIVLADAAFTLPTESLLLSTNTLTLSDQFLVLATDVNLLSESNSQLDSDVKILPDDSPILSDWYRNALSINCT